MNRLSRRMRTKKSGHCEVVGFRSSEKLIPNTHTYYVQLPISQVLWDCRVRPLDILTWSNTAYLPPTKLIRAVGNARNRPRQHQDGDNNAIQT